MQGIYRAVARISQGGSDIPYLLGLVMIVMCLYFPLLFGGEMLSGDERVDGYYQYSIMYDRAIEHGDTFLWNEHSYGGFPTYLNQFGSFLFPPVYGLFYLLDPIIAFHVAIAVATVIGLVFSYLFGRALDLSRDASFILAIAYATAQIPGTFHLGLSYAHSFAFLPVLLFAILRAKRAPTTPVLVLYIAFAGIAIGSGLLAGYFVTVVYGLLLAGLLALFLDMFGVRLGYQRTVRATMTLACGFVIGLTIGSPQLIPLIEYQPHISRTAAFAQESAIGSGVQWLDLIRFVIPHHFQYPLDPGRGYFYFGLLPLLGGIVALLFIRTDIRIAFFASVYVIFLSFAANLPVFEWINVHVPPFSRMGSVSRWLLVGAFAVAALAAIGFDRMRELHSEERLRRIMVYVIRMITACIVMLALIQFPLYAGSQAPTVRAFIFEQVLRASGRTEESLRHTREFYDNLISEQLATLHHAFSFQNPHYFIFILLALVSIIGFNAYIRKPTERGKQALIVFAALAAIASFAGGLGNRVERELYFARWPAAAEAIRSREQNVSDYRYVAFQGDRLSTVTQSALLTPEERAVIMRELLYREVGTAYGLRNIAGFEPIRSRRQNQLVDAALAPTSGAVLDEMAIASGAPIDSYWNTAILRPSSYAQKVDEIIGRIPLLSALNVKYVLSLYPLIDERLTPIPVEPTEDFPVDLNLYEITAPLPRLYVASGSVIWQGDERSLLLAMLEEDDFSSTTYIECTGCSARFGTGLVENARARSGYASGRALMNDDGIVVFMESNLPGWIAEINGERTSINTANYLFQAINVPKGEHDIRFCYPGSFALFLERVGLRNVSCANW